MEEKKPADTLRELAGAIAMLSLPQSNRVVDLYNFTNQLRDIGDRMLLIAQGLDAPGAGQKTDSGAK